MDVVIGEKGLDCTWQQDFPPETKCFQCDGMARIGFVAHEAGDEEKQVRDLHNNNGASGGNYWLHDACSVAVYFCKKCLQPTALYNQA